MREIKFRAWDKKSKYMFALDDKDFFINNNGIYERSSVDYFGDEYKNVTDNLILMQYTGLKDMKGREIYDGDIIKLCYGIPPTYDTLVIEYADDENVNDCSVSGWWMRNVRENGCSSSLCKTYGPACEVIGNIHEDGDLRKERNSNA